MSAQHIYHRAFAWAAAISLWAYAVYSARLGQVFLPMHHGRRNVVAPLWSDDLAWMSVGGFPAWALMAAMVVAGLGLILLPAPAPTQGIWEKQAKREAMAKRCLLVSGGLVALGLLLGFVLTIGTIRPTRDVRQIQEQVRQERVVQARFGSTKALWGGLGSVLLVGLLIDLGLRHRAGRQRAA